MFEDEVELLFLLDNMRFFYFIIFIFGSSLIIRIELYYNLVREVLGFLRKERDYF